MRDGSKQDQIKVLIAGRDLNGTGGGRVIVETAKGLSRLGCDVTVLADAYAAELRGEVEVRTTPFGNALYRWKTKNKFTRLLRHNLQVFCFMGFGTLQAANFRKRGYVIFNHNIDILTADALILHNVVRVQAAMDQRSAFRKVLRYLNPVISAKILRERWILSRGKVSTIVAVSWPAMQDAKPMMRRDRELAVIHNGVDVTKFKPSFVSPEVDSSTLPLLFIAHQFEAKGLRYVIEALSSLPQRIVLWVGGGRSSNVDVYREYANSLGVADRVQFFGTVDTVDLYQKCFAFVLPTDYETFGMVLIEAMACAKPVLAHPVGGIVDFLRDEENGMFIKQEADDIASKVMRLVSDADLRSKLSAAALATAEEHAWDKVTGKYFQILSALHEGNKDVSK
ncbi:glycosyltransferase family 4 protein [Paraburkholderia aromaticivorans]|uniref:glycosyltransferase family 4 protein n=1 Tax=Paraburkholderia aromaticivorans TaxID=2026199 RepID=UPI001455F570|nr:glycosyltransferase family 4 protein [Paraburkholderia aromaticivorans]